MQCWHRYLNQSNIFNSFSIICRLFVGLIHTQPTSEPKSTKSRTNSSPRLTSSSWWGTCRCRWRKRTLTRCSTLLIRIRMGRLVIGKQQLPPSTKISIYSIYVLFDRWSSNSISSFIEFIHFSVSSKLWSTHRRNQQARKRNPWKT